MKMPDLFILLGDGMGEIKPLPQPFAFLVSQASRTATYGSPKREGSN